MTRENILETLTHSLTTTNIRELRTKESDKAFLKHLIGIYENQVSGYVSRCFTRALRQVREGQRCPEEYYQAMALQHIVDYALSAILKVDKAFLLSSFASVLRKHSPTSLMAVGLSITYKTGDTTHYLHLHEQVKSVFVQYIVRYRLSNEIAANDLQDLCQSVAPADPELFPLYLVQSFSQQKAIREVIQQNIPTLIRDGRSENDGWAQELSNGIRAYPNLFYQCLSGFIFYIGKTLQMCERSDDENAYFNHLNDDAQLRSFTHLMADGYLQQMNTAANWSTLYLENTFCTQDAWKIICQPYLTWVGLRFQAENGPLQQRQRDLNDTLSSLASQSREIRAATETAITQNKTRFEAQLSQGAGQLEREAQRRLSEIQSETQKAHTRIEQWRSGFKPNINVSTSTGPTHI